MRRGPRIDSPKRIKANEKVGDAIRLRKQGWSYEEISQACGYTSAPVAFKAVRDALAASRSELKESAADLLQIEVDRVDLLWKHVADKLASGEAKPATLKAGIDVLARKAKLLGLDKPTQHEHLLTMSESEANNSSDIRLAVVLLQKCFMVHGEDPMLIAKEAIRGLGDMAQALPEHIPDAEIVDD